MIGVALKRVYLVFVRVCRCVRRAVVSDDVCAKPLIKTTG